MSSRVSWVSLSHGELEQELQRIFSCLFPKSTVPRGKGSDEWKQRLLALHELQACARADLSARRNFSQTIASFFKVALLEQLEDHRPQIVCEACKVVRDFVMYSTNREVCALLSIWYVPTLLRLTRSTASVIQHSAREVLYTILTAGRCNAQVLGYVLRACCARHAAIRISSFEVVSKILQQAKGTSKQLLIAKYSLPICRVIRGGLIDADWRVRRIARTCYWAFFSIEPRAVGELLQGLPKSVAAILEDTKAAAFQCIGAVQPIQNGSSLGSKDELSRKPSCLEPAGAPTSTRAVQATQQGNRITWDQALFLGDEKNGGRTINAVCEDLRVVAARKARALMAHQHPTSNIQLASNTLDSASQRLAAGLQRVHSRNFAPPLVSAVYEPPTGVGIAGSLERSRGLRFADLHPQEASFSLTRDKCEALKPRLRSHDWRVRLEAIQALQSNCTYLDVQVQDVCVNEVVNQLDDSHFRVREATLQLLKALLNQFGVDALQLYLDKIVPALVGNVDSPKEAIKVLARHLLTCVVEGCDSSRVFDSLLRCIACVSTVNLRKRTIEALQLAFVTHSSYFSKPTPIYRGLAVLAHQLSCEARKRASVVWQACLNALGALYTLSPCASFIRALGKLEEKTQGLVREALHTVLPEFEDGRVTTGTLDGPAARANQPQESSRMCNVAPPSLEPYRNERRNSTPKVSTVAAPNDCVDVNGKWKKKSSHSLCMASWPSDIKREEVDSVQPHLRPPFSSTKAALKIRNRHDEVAQMQSDNIVSDTLLEDFDISHNVPLAPLLAASLKPNTLPASKQKVGMNGTVAFAHTHLFDSPFLVKPFSSSRDEPYELARDLEMDRFVRKQGGLAKPSLFTKGGRPSQHTDEIDMGAGFVLSSLSPQELIAGLLHSRDCLERCEALERILNSLHEQDANVSWADEELAPKLFVVLEQYCSEAHQPDHSVRRRAFGVLEAIIELPFMRPLVARHLSRLLRYCRTGIDDAFLEVQQEAALTMQRILHGNKLPLDLCLNGLTSCLEAWQQGPDRYDCTRGWLELLNEVGRLFQRLSVDLQSRRQDASRTLTGAILRRVVHVLQCYVEHCATKAREGAILALVSMWMALGSNALAFFAPLSAAQRELVTTYYNRAIQDVHEFLPQAGTLFSPKQTSCVVERAEGASFERDLGAEMRAMGLAEGN